MIKRENTKIEKARKKEENANEVLDDMIPKLEAVTNEGEDGSAELTVEKIIETMITDGGPYGEIGRNIIKYQSKEKAIQDAILALRDNS